MDKYSAKQLAKGHTQMTQRIIEERLGSLLHPLMAPSLLASSEESEDEPYELAIELTGMFSDTSPYDISDSEEESDDVVEYNTETSHDSCQLQSPAEETETEEGLA